MGILKKLVVSIFRKKSIEDIKEVGFDEWYASQQQKFTQELWFTGYAEGRMQEKYGIVDFPYMIANPPMGKKLTEGGSE